MTLLQLYLLSGLVSMIMMRLELGKTELFWWLVAFISGPLYTITRIALLVFDFLFETLPELLKKQV